MSEQAPQPADEPQQEPDLSQLMGSSDYTQEAIPDPDEGVDFDDTDDLRDRVTTLENAANIGGPDHLMFDKVFPARLNTDGTFTELLVTGGTISDFTAGRTNDTTNTYTHLLDGGGLVVEMEDTDASGNPRTGWLHLPNPATMAYLTNNTGGGYDVWADTASTLQLASNLSPETSSGLFQYNGTAGRLLQVGNSYQAFFASGTLNSFSNLSLGTFTLQAGTWLVCGQFSLTWPANDSTFQGAILNVGNSNNGFYTYLTASIGPGQLQVWGSNNARVAMPSGIISSGTNPNLIIHGLIAVANIGTGFPNATASWYFQAVKIG